MRIVIVEDNISLAQGIAHRLRDQGHAVDLLHDGEQCKQFLAHEKADIVVLDINLPKLSGLEIIKSMRLAEDETPVILLSARGDTTDRVAGLDAGADDYLVKPFEMEELDARIRALLRRKPRQNTPIEKMGRLSFDRSARRLFVDGEYIEIPRRELAVFECFLDRSEQVVPKSVLINHLYGVGADVDEKVVEVYISRLRKRLGPFGVQFKVARGLGYLMITP